MKCNECSYNRNEPNNDTTQGTYPCGQYHCWELVYEANSNFCVSCGEEIPEGIQVCYNCLNK